MEKKRDMVALEFISIVGINVIKMAAINGVKIMRLTMFESMDPI